MFFKKKIISIIQTEFALKKKKKKENLKKPLLFDLVCSERPVLRVTPEQVSKLSALALGKTATTFIMASLSLLSQTLAINTI